MTLDVAEFIRRCLIHVLPKGFHRIRHYGLLASGAKADNLAPPAECSMPSPPDALARRPRARLMPAHQRGVPGCGSAMRIIEMFEAWPNCAPSPVAQANSDPDRHLMRTRSQSHSPRPPDAGLMARRGHAAPSESAS